MLTQEIVDTDRVTSQTGMPKRLPKRPPDYLSQLLPSWQLSLRSERKSESTVKVYTDGVQGFLKWCDSTNTPASLTKQTVQQFTAHLLSEGAEPATARSRQLALKRYSAWLAEEGEIDAYELLGLKPPKLDTKVTDSLTDAQVKAFIKACSGKEFRDIRDTPIARLMLETGMRAQETLDIKVSDVDLDRGLVTVRRGKGGKGRVVAISAQTATAIDRYIRARRIHRLAGTDVLWLGDRGKGLAYFGLRNTLQYRAQRAGIAHFHVHLTRHTAATRWLRAAGSEGGLMAVAGWSTRDMIDRYTGASASERAAEEARSLNLGDV
jgi:site-specific recombinase XerD